MNKPQFYNQTEIDFLRSLNDSELEMLLREFPETEQRTIIGQLTERPDEHSKDIQRKRESRSKAAEVVISPVVDMERRISCLADPELFLRTYGAKTFYNPFAEHHRRMIAAIHERAISGGDKAVAAPRGDGKTQVASWMVIYILLAELVRFPVIIASTRKHAQKIFKQIKQTFSWNELLCGDFPEIGDCVQALDGAPQRAAKQHVNGQKTKIIWTQDEIGLPHVPGSPYGGCYVTYFGLDSAIRGVHYNGVRPDFALIDDPETREVAFSETQHHSIEEMIDGDIAGLAGPNSTISRVILTTIQNRRCYSYRVTDPKKKPTFAGERYGVLAKWPDNREIWEEYIAKRQQGQSEGDKDGLEALQFYLDNREEMESGAVVTNEHRFNQRTNEDGQQVEVSAIQAFFNRIADWGLPRVLAELQNDPEEDETEQTLGLTAGIVQSRISGLNQNELPREDVKIVCGIDIGKYWSHWAKIAFWGNATGSIIDYGVMETPGMQTATDSEAVQVALLKSLMQWGIDIQHENPCDLVFVDSGDYTDAVYEFTRRMRGVFKPTKGHSDSRMSFSGSDTEAKRHFTECRSDYQQAEGVWLFHVNANYWKHVVHQRFITETFNAAHQFNDGTLSLYVPKNAKDHNSFSHHIVAEEYEELFVEGKGLQKKWVVKNKNNHWLDATALACCAASVMGIKTLQRAELHRVQPQQAEKKPSTPQPQQQSQTNRFKSRPGGWIPRRGR